MKYRIGAKTSVSKMITETDIIEFAEISGDYNPVHLNQKTAEKSVFGNRIAHGFLVGSIISNAIGMKLPGPGTIYLEQDMKFLKPVFIGDTVTAVIEVTDIINENKNILKLSTIVTNQETEIVIDGYAVVKAP